jgi:hypothetical protein
VLFSKDEREFEEGKGEIDSACKQKTKTIIKEKIFIATPFIVY